MPKTPDAFEALLAGYPNAVGDLARAARRAIRNAAPALTETIDPQARVKRILAYALADA